ncbi:MAG: DUF4827 family protein [Prevotella sp.]|nr:DUF4827 family protein [Prevotella sp.]MDY3898187.1 DUF4827 family protein [Prevotella sp.]
MRKLAYFMMLVIGVVTIISCNYDETYADQKERERNAIAKFVSDSAIHVISEEEFANKGYTTDVSKNEPPSYVAQQTIRQTELLSDVMQE